MTVRHPQRWFGFSALGSALFIALTTAAMFCYPGGTPDAPQRHGYSFFTNVFSDLGRSRTFDGRGNRVSQVLFITAMSIGAAALVTFFRAFAVTTSRRRTATSRRAARHLSHAASLFGVAAAACFVGVGATPWDLFAAAHFAFVIWAFRLFLGGIVLNLIAVLLEPALPRRAAWLFAGFAALLLAYIVLLSAGLTPGPAAALLVQATGQKVIVYSAIVTVLLQSLHMRRHLSAVPITLTDPTPSHAT